MELRAFALKLLSEGHLDEKLFTPPSFTDFEPGDAKIVLSPQRIAPWEISREKKVKTPKLQGMPDPAQRVRILHALANHELQAVELFAWAILAFPEAPKTFRQGLAKIVLDEQRHFRMYAARMESMGTAFGDFPITGHFWTKIETITTPLQFVCMMGLTFENANLDFAQEYIDAATRAGDHETADILEAVHKDEILHVRFGWHWLNAFKSSTDSHWDAYNENVNWPLGPSRARGANFDKQARRKAGFSEEFIGNLQDAVAESPGGSHR